MQPFDHAWRLLKSYTSTPAVTRSLGGHWLPDTSKNVAGHRIQGNRNLGLPPYTLRREHLNELQPRPPTPAANHAALANLSDEEFEALNENSKRIHQEYMQRQSMDEMERRIDAGEVTPTDIFDEGGNAAAGEGYMSGGRQY